MHNEAGSAKVTIVVMTSRSMNITSFCHDHVAACDPSALAVATGRSRVVLPACFAEQLQRLRCCHCQLHVEPAIELRHVLPLTCQAVEGSRDTCPVAALWQPFCQVSRNGTNETNDRGWNFPAMKDGIFPDTELLDVFRGEVVALQARAAAAPGPLPLPALQYELAQWTTLLPPVHGLLFLATQDAQSRAAAAASVGRPATCGAAIVSAVSYLQLPRHSKCHRVALPVVPVQSRSRQLLV